MTPEMRRDGGGNGNKSVKGYFTFLPCGFKGGGPKRLLCEWSVKIDWTRQRDRLKVCVETSSGALCMWLWLSCWSWTFFENKCLKGISPALGLLFFALSSILGVASALHLQLLHVLFCFLVRAKNVMSTQLHDVYAATIKRKPEASLHSPHPL